MISVIIPTGSANIVPDSAPITLGNFGYNYTGFKSFSRFASQMADSRVGLISWPGGSLAENQPANYGLNYPDLWNGNIDFGLDRLFDEAAKFGAGVSIVLPTKRYMDQPQALQSELNGFLDRLLAGSLGPLPDRLIFEVGSEYYATFGTGAENAAIYGRIAEQMVGTITDALSDPTRNPGGADIEIAVQAGRTLDEDAAIRGELGPDTLRNVDMLIYHRFAPYATGIDRSIDVLDQAVDDWQVAMEAAGGARPTIFMSSYNVASYTRAEALRDYVDDQAALGNVIDPNSIDTDARTDDGFENYWQAALTKRHYGIEQTRVLLELQSHVGSIGMGAASAYGTDMQHPARLTWTSTDGDGHDFVGQDILDMMQESTLGTRILKVSIQNDQEKENLWVYGYENNDKLVAFVAWHNLAPGPLKIDVPGLTSGTYKAVWSEGLHAEVRPDWKQEFGIPDNPNVDETPESLSFAEGVRTSPPMRLQDGSLFLDITREHEILRLSFAKTDAGMTDIQTWENSDPVLLGDDGLPDPVPLPDDDQDPTDDDDVIDAGDDGGAGALLGGMLGVLVLVAVAAAAM